eukprot:8810886-Lingulodinium_polyedra.AAC.1
MPWPTRGSCRTKRTSTVWQSRGVWIGSSLGTWPPGQPPRSFSRMATRGAKPSSTPGRPSASSSGRL